MDDRRVVAARGVHRCAHQRRLPGARFTDEQRDARPAGQPVAQVQQCLAVSLREEEKTRVRRQIERPLAQAVKLFVHHEFRSRGAAAATRLRRDAGTFGIVARTRRFSTSRASSSERMLRSKYSVTAAKARPMASASTTPSTYSFGRSGLDGFSGSRAGSSTLNCSPIWRRSRFDAICESCFLASSDLYACSNVL